MKLGRWWRALDPAWRYALGVYAVGRIALTVWSLVLLALFPLRPYNVEYRGAPVLATFDLASSERQVYARQVGGALLTFRAGARGYVTDVETGSAWSLRDGRAVSGAYLGATLTPLSELRETFFPYRDAAPDSNLLLALWQRFDTNWYLAIAEFGYGAHPGDSLFPPLYPALIRVLGDVLGGQYLLAAWLISNSALVAALALFYQLVTEWASPGVAARAAAYLVLFPTGFFLFAAYTESLYLLFTLLMFRALARGELERAGVWTGLGILTRLQGIALLAPMALAWWRAPARSLWRGVRAVVPASLAAGVFLGMRAWVVPTSIVPTSDPAWPVRFALPWENYWNGIQILASGQFQMVDVLNMLIATLFAVIVAIGWRDLAPAYRWYATASWLVVMTHWVDGQALGSMARYMLSLFPCFMLLAKWGANAWVNRAIVYLSFPLNLCLSAQFVMWGWVA